MHNIIILYAEQNIDVLQQWLVDRPLIPIVAIDHSNYDSHRICIDH